MSTSYYHFKAPITLVRLEQGATHDRLTIFERHANTGTLTLSKGTGPLLLQCFVETVDDNLAPLRSHYGGSDRGTVVTVHDLQLDPDAFLIDEYGRVFRVKDILALDKTYHT